MTGTGMERVDMIGGCSDVRLYRASEGPLNDEGHARCVA